jgi:hypothetical protein
MTLADPVSAQTTRDARADGSATLIALGKYAYSFKITGLALNPSLWTRSGNPEMPDP